MSSEQGHDGCDLCRGTGVMRSSNIDDLIRQLKGECDDAPVVESSCPCVAEGAPYNRETMLLDDPWLNAPLTQDELDAANAADDGIGKSW